MFSDLINTLTLKKWLAIGAIVAIAVVSGYFMLSSQADTNKGAFGGSFGGGVKTLGGTEKEDSQLKTAAQVAEEKAGQAAGEKKQDTTLKTAAELEADKATENKNPLAQNFDTKIGIFNDVSQPTAADIPVPSNNDEYVEVLKFKLKTTVAMKSPINTITLTKSGNIDLNQLDIVISTGAITTPPQSRLMIDATNLNLIEGDNTITVKVRAKAADDSLKNKTLTLSIPSSDAFALNNKDLSMVSSENTPPFPIRGSIFTAKKNATAALEVIVPTPDANALPVVLDDLILGRQIPLGDTPTAVFGFKITSPTTINLTDLTVQLADSIENPLEASKIQAGLFIQSGDTAERNVSEYKTPNNGLYTFDRITAALITANQETRIIIKTRISADAGAGKNFKFKIAAAENITLTGGKTVSIPASGLIGNTMIIAAAEVAPVSPCALDSLCPHTATVNEVAPATLVSGANTQTTVLDFSFAPSPGANLRSLVVSLDTGVTPPAAPRERIRAYLYEFDADNNEVDITDSAGGLSANANGTFSFNTLNRVLNELAPTHYLVKARILPASDATPVSYLVQNFKFKIRDEAHVVLNDGHVFDMQNPIEGAPMSIAAAACADGLIPNEAGNACEEATPPPPPPLVCADNEHDENGRCVLNGEVLVEATNVCPNLPNGPYAAPPAGYKIEGNSCVEMVDLCPLSPDGIQETIPAGTTLNASGACVAVVQTPPTCAANQQLNADRTACVAFTPTQEQVFACSNIGMFNYDGPARPDTPQNTCIPCESALYISSNKTCKEPAAEGTNNGNSDQTAGNSSGNPATRNAAFEGDANGQASLGGMDLGQSQRLTYVPERGNTGPGILIYILGGGLAPAVAYGLRRMKK